MINVSMFQSLIVLLIVAPYIFIRKTGKQTNPKTWKQ